MKNRLPVVLSATALVVAVLGVTPVGQATSTAIQTHFARNANFLRGKAPSIKAGKNKIPAANKAGKLDPSWGAVGPRGLPGRQARRRARSAQETLAATGAPGAPGAPGPAERRAGCEVGASFRRRERDRTQSGGISLDVHVHGRLLRAISDRRSVARRSS